MERIMSITDNGSEPIVSATEINVARRNSESLGKSLQRLFHNALR